MCSTEIISVLGREVLDSRGNPTVEAEVHLTGGTICTAIAPSGASTGKFEAAELRDNDMQYYMGKGVKNACKNINTEISKAICGMDASDLHAVDRAMIILDGTQDKSALGANAILAVSMACAKAAANAQHIALYRFLGGIQGVTLPMPMMNILNGGVHASNRLDIQEFMIVPVGANSFKEALRMCTEVYHSLALLLKKKNLSTSVGDEGGYAADVKGEAEALDLILEAISRAGYSPGSDFQLALDAAASEWKTREGYTMPKSKRVFAKSELCAYWEDLISRYPICSIEDPFGEDDWNSWSLLTSSLNGRCQLVGDDLFVTNATRLARGIRLSCGNAILLKPNQIGTISETMHAAQTAQQNGYRTILSHRSGDTEDTTIADLAVAINAGQIKSGAPCRSERVCKYNRLLRIEESLGCAAVFKGLGINR